MATVVIVASWCAALLYWRSHGATPSVLQGFVGLVLVPCGLLAAGLMVRGALRHRPVAESEAAPEVDDGVNLAGGLAQQESAVMLVAAGLNLGDGMGASTPAELSGRQPSLSRRFRDAHGLPVRLSAAADLDEAWVLTSQQSGFDVAVHEQRALALLEPLLEVLLDSVTKALPELEGEAEVVVAGLRRRAVRDVERVLLIECLVPAEWSAPLRHWAHGWLQSRAQQAGLDSRRFEVRLTAVEGAYAAWRHLDMCSRALASGTPRWHLLLACCSHIDQSLINAWLAAGVLATATKPDGRVPGEAAAGVLLCSAALAAAGNGQRIRLDLPADAEPGPQHPAERRRRLAALASEWQQSCRLEGDRLQFVLHEAGLDPDAVIDAAAMASAINPDIEFSQQSLSLPRHAGDIGVVLPFAQLALAAAQCQSEHAVLVLAKADARQPIFALVDSFPQPCAA